eukprot:TRINITY_DN521_c0_g1_i3.p1 TRINITY_DN521_c0_g1~~TRINITY_DN521_c0_g1_i3.p1  ORF type:complete len:398 (+),score=46.59 TRINITY_DN521_c0_g1_i3:39-1196(+)
MWSRLTQRGLTPWRIGALLVCFALAVILLVTLIADIAPAASPHSLTSLPPPPPPSPNTDITHSPGTILFDSESPAASSLDEENSMAFLILGDWGEPGTNVTTIAARSETENVSFVLTLGDNFYDNGVRSVEDPLWQQTFERVYNDSVFQVPWYICVGNHDVDGLANAQAQIDYSQQSTRWNLPSLYHSTTVTLPDGETTLGIIILDTINLVERQDLEQVRWLQHTLASSSAEFLIVVGHTPIYSVGEHGSSAFLIANVLPLLQQYQVSVYLCGHNHGIQHLTLGGSEHAVESLQVGNTARFTVQGGGEYPPVAAAEDSGLVQVHYYWPHQQSVVTYCTEHIGGEDDGLCNAFAIGRVYRDSLHLTVFNRCISPQFHLSPLTPSLR